MQEREREESKRALSPNLTPQVNQMGLAPLYCAVWQLIDIQAVLVIDITYFKKISYRAPGLSEISSLTKWPWTAVQYPSPAVCTWDFSGSYDMQST